MHIALIWVPSMRPLGFYLTWKILINFVNLMTIALPKNFKNMQVSKSSSESLRRTKQKSLR
ncbi:hypothetical protein HYC85_021855 [Camellia sinensis]|uniref:Uncharacterized protein n=1 Tax=Camellia sinensis TaxID=4442 RepID=A0A7J7GMS1_CAMSI|nr:hypothetical protein HYC85_021855 [Camellia sinensis]